MMSSHRNRTRRLLAASAVVTTMGAACALAGASPAVAGGEFFVAASAGDDGNPCTAAEPCRTIGHAVAIADDGSRVSVAPGTYAETVSIDKRLRLRGDDAVVDATGHDNGIVVRGPSAAGTRIRGFTVENANAEGILADSTSDLGIFHNELRNNDRTPNVASPPQCAAQGEVPGDCGEALHLMGVSFSRVVGNEIRNNVGGILITDETGPSHGNRIAHNITRDNVEDCGITLPSHNAMATTDPAKAGVYDNTVVDNLSQGNGGAGVGMFAPFPGTASYDNRVIGNTLLDNGEAGIAIHAHAPGENVAGNVIKDNTVGGNGVDPDAGSGNPVGIALLNADPATTPGEIIAANHVSDEFWGIFINGSFAIRGLGSNHFDASVATPVGHHS
ncbi:MAG TPA: right-handed parallel beta-helix repeat-containing protein [Baekduia sp.]|nr:right-handed parallel beta-helix repeat-containing protein [Baekduia sp.]